MLAAFNITSPPTTPPAYSSILLYKVSPFVMHCNEQYPDTIITSRNSSVYIFCKNKDASERVYLYEFNEETSSFHDPQLILGTLTKGNDFTIIGSSVVAYTNEETSSTARGASQWGLAISIRYTLNITEPYGEYPQPTRVSSPTAYKNRPSKDLPTLAIAISVVIFVLISFIAMSIGNKRKQQRQTQATEIPLTHRTPTPPP
ncbi:hypothetical protein BG011_010206 [Mortierella polycephala]|uniref:Uncharacterized protein n=1 Tax=Mortierella polycephala TaxID=41804 RepID=A0A9P6Q8Q9_9FUNG|nr:hypothetical protein BG011_010206 [Mortierella polycephala]